MIIKNLQNSTKVPFDLDGHILHSEKQIELVHLLLKPGETLAEHKNPFDVIFFVVGGSGVLSVEGGKIELNPSDTIKVTSEEMRAWANTSNMDLRLLVIKLL